MNSAICSAISNKHLLELRYHGYSRLVEPYAYGREGGGVILLRCYQQSGGSESGQTTGWKLLKVAEIFLIQEINKSFNPRQTYRHNDKAMKFIFCQI
ncbi:hypothetical protein [Burkholderia sp. Bp8992]|uniref:hypothetical protein n=1 Tax=Burkholderia sp. Bp8992 TaxID=2184554 RepID=UPI000F56759D|nr:hypothetical protein [Burkholderia sp. Bp8992]